MLGETAEKILYEIERYRKEKGISPTIRELCDLVGLKSTSSIHRHLESLEKKGYIKKHPTCPRTIILASEVKEIVEAEIKPSALKEEKTTVEILVKEIRRLKLLIEKLGV